MKTIRERTVEILDTSSLSDPREIADKILGDLPARQLREALAETLPQYVRLVVHNSRRDGPRSHAPCEAHSSPASGPSRSTPATAPAGSSRWRKASAGVFARRICPAGTWKMLGECVKDDVLALVSERRDLAAANAAEADKFDRLHLLMIDSGADTVAELPEAKVEEILR